ncbi:MAG TPA: hypothetical protein VN253_08690 [Kofleriaceae bacterium]|nr:hypothetical protein [Kofleriaceae bacterium]
MPVAEFEERSFEAALNVQLLVETTQLYSPGQVLEAVLGFDVALLTQHVSHWRLWNLQALAGSAMTDAWGSTDVTQPLSRLPDFKLNVFLQHKRPSFMAHGSGAEWAAWARPYYRYAISPHQQSTLEQFAAALGRHGLVIYAAPAFWSVRDLCSFTARATLVENTSLVEAAELHGQKIYTYAAARTNGIAFSPLAEIPALSRPGALLDRICGAAEVPSGSNVFKLADRALSAALATFPPLQEAADPIGERALHALSLIRQALPQGPEEKAMQEIILPYLRVVALSWLLGVDWLISGPARRNRR